MRFVQIDRYETGYVLTTKTLEGGSIHSRNGEEYRSWQLAKDRLFGMGAPLDEIETNKLRLDSGQDALMIQIP
jgi:hypothetical protein